MSAIGAGHGSPLPPVGTISLRLRISVLRMTPASVPHGELLPDAAGWLYLFHCRTDAMTRNLRITLLLVAVLVSIGTADAQQAPDPRVADLVKAGKIRIGLFSTQYSKDPVKGDLKGVRADIARACSAHRHSSGPS